MSEEEVGSFLESSAEIELENATYSFSRHDAAGAKGMKIWVHQVLYVSPGDVLFSLPTINDGLPEVNEIPAGPDLLRMPEDSWRQLEVVSNPQEEAVEACLAEIRKVYLDGRAGAGFRRLHLRTEVRRPLEGVKLSLPELIDRVLGDGKRYDGVTFADAQRVIPNGFALQTPPGLTLYGQTEGDLVQVVAMIEPPSAWEDPFFRLLRDLNLRMINWVEAQTLLPPGS